MLTHFRRIQALPPPRSSSGTTSVSMWGKWPPSLPCSPINKQQLLQESGDGPFQPSVSRSEMAQPWAWAEWPDQPHLATRSELHITTEKNRSFIPVSQREPVHHGEEEMKNEWSKSTLCPSPSSSLRAVQGRTRWFSMTIPWIRWTHVEVPSTHSVTVQIQITGSKWRFYWSYKN